MFVKERNKISLQSHDIHVRVALVYPNVYEMGMSSYTIHLIYSMFNSYPGILCERFFLPKQKNINMPLKSMDSGTPLREFDIIAFSVHYELDYINILWIMENLGFPYLGENRSKGEYPLIIAGGSAVKSNPLILLPFIDLLVFGDFEPIYDEFCNNLVEFSAKNRSFNQICNSTNLLSKPNIIVSQVALQYLSSKSNEKGTFPVNRQHLVSLDDSECPTTQIIPQFKSPEQNLVFGETFLLEINRGCPSGCRFCLTGFVNRPFRNRSISQIKHLIDESLQNTGAGKITLIGSAVADHPDFEDICKFIVEKKQEIMIPSIRIDKINPTILKILRKGGAKSLTIAPETGSDLLRQKLNKNLCNSDIIQQCVDIFQHGFQSIKMYFLIGLPFEQPEDIQAIIDLIKEIQTKVGKKLPKNAFRLSINPFIPKFFTPFNAYTNHYIDKKMEYFRRIEKKLRSEFENMASVDIDFLNWKEARLQVILSQLDESFASFLIEFYENNALPVTMNRLDKKHDNIITRYLQDSADSFGKNLSHSVEKVVKLINIGFKENYLIDELKNAEKGLTFSCEDGCYRCGLC